jgi:nucleotide-binding universal stress UspA family protein
MSTQPNLQTIVVATDFSRNAGLALSWAQRLARLHDARLVLVHAARPEPSVPPPFVPTPKKHDEEIRADARARLDQQAETALRSGVHVDCELAFGSAVDVIVATAARCRADLVVAGRRGPKDLKHLLVGSTATGLIRAAGCPVVTIHPTDPGPEKPMRTILVPTDFSDAAELAARAAMRILGYEGADRRIVLLHAYHVPYEATYLPAQTLAEALSTANLDAKQKIDALAARLRDTGIAVDTVTYATDPAEAILMHAETVGADLIAMSTHGLSGFDRLLAGSTTERVVTSAVCPVLTVRRN